MHRPRGWIQDSGSLDKLIKVVEIFNHGSLSYNELLKEVSLKIDDEEKKREILDELKTDVGLNGNPRLSYSCLVGTRTKADAVDSIIQCLIKGQGSRTGIVDWACDNFIRFAYTLDFISFDEKSDSYSITKLGLQLSKSHGVKQKYEYIKEAFKQYPPLIRVLYLLSQQLQNEPDNPSLTKFELGKELGFRGEDGFSTYSVNVIIQALNSAEDDSFKKKIRQNWEGSSDKYARMISAWMIDENIKWVKRVKKKIRIRIGSEEFIENFTSYQITSDGIRALQSCRAYSRNKGTIKNVPYEMFATKGGDKDYLRKRRALTLQYLKRYRTIKQIKKYLLKMEICTNEESIIDDIKNFSRIGLDIVLLRDTCRLKDKIKPISIPENIRNGNINPSELEEIKQILRKELNCLDHQFLDVLDFSIAGNNSATLFEVRIVDLLNEIIVAKHLTGGSRPEIIGYSPKVSPKKCLLFDSKSYKGGFSIPANERDKMIRYIEEYNAKDAKLNPNRWWENYTSPDYPSEEIIFGFVSGKFIGRYNAQLLYIKQRTKRDGCAITAESLLRKVNKVICENDSYTINNFFDEIASNKLLS